MGDLSRRGFLLSACALTTLAFAAPAAEAATSTRTLPDGRLVVQVRRFPELAQVGGAVRVGTVKGRPVGVVRTGASSYRAFDLACPHQGVTVARSATGWSCPAHGSAFEADGDLELGPATSGLRRVPVAVKGGTLTIG